MSRDAKPPTNETSGADDRSEPATDTERPETEADQPHRSDEIGGPKGPEPTRFGDWERKGRCIDF